MLSEVKDKSTTNAVKSERSAVRVMVSAWNFALDLVWLGMVACIIGLFIWGLVRTGVVTDQSILLLVADKVDLFILGIGGDR